MAKKLRKRSHRTSPLILFSELLLPWIVLSIMLVIGVEAKLSIAVNISLALLASVASMFFIRWERSVRKVKELHDRPKARKIPKRSQ